MEHIEEAGIHSGDSACSLPPQHLSDEILHTLKQQTRDLAFALKVVGLMNIQFAIRENKIYLLEVNPRVGSLPANRFYFPVWRTEYSSTRQLSVQTPNLVSVVSAYAEFRRTDVVAAGNRPSRQNECRLLQYVP